jgi:hypothetical protein
VAFFLGFVIGALVSGLAIWLLGRSSRDDELERLRTQELVTMWQIDAISRGAQAQMRQAARQARKRDGTT